MIDWSEIFVRKWAQPGASEADIQHLVTETLSPLTPNETKQPKEEKWWIPNRPFPATYISFLRWSNGGCFINGQRSFNDFFTVAEIREMLLDYEIPEYMPGAVPFAFDGGGTFYLFDMREEAVDGEYPIVFTHAGNLDWEDAIHVADSFSEACRGTKDPYALQNR